jgi:UDP-glucose 4-epimerase
MSILVCGGAGYVGSHTVYALIENGEDVIVVDNLQKGHMRAVHMKSRFYNGDIRDRDFMSRVFRENHIHAVIHFAAESLVGESVTAPLKYYHNNVFGAISLLDVMREFGVNAIVFSSSAAVYGEPGRKPIMETDTTEPTNPYGETKLAVERLLKWSFHAYGISYAILRYFNVAGAHHSGLIGEDHRPETHLIPIVLGTALGKQRSVSVFGTDYPTKDGTCVRDYIHVCDLADAHILAMSHLLSGGAPDIYNLGNGEGFSVMEIIETCGKVTGHAIQTECAARRAGDPSMLVASSEKIVRDLKWKPRLNDIGTIIESAWRWHKNNPDGFGD